MSVTDDFGLLYFIQNINDKSKPLFDKLLVVGKPKGITKDNISSLKMNNRGAIIKTDGSSIWENRLYKNSITDTTYINLDSYEDGISKAWLTTNKFWILFYNGSEFKVLYNPIYRPSYNIYKSIYALDASIVNKNYCDIVGNSTDSNCPKKETSTSNIVPLAAVAPSAGGSTSTTPSSTTPSSTTTSSTTTSSTAPSSTTPPSSNLQNKAEEDNSTLIIGVGITILFLILIIVGFFIYKKIKNKQSTEGNTQITPEVPPKAYIYV